MPSASGFPTRVLVTGSQKQEGGILVNPSHCPAITGAIEQRHKWNRDSGLGRAILSVASYQSSGFWPALINPGVRKLNTLGL